MDAAAESIDLPPSESLQAGDQLGRYQLLCPIARGGMGQVWAARQAGRLGLPKLVAIKVALPLESGTYQEVQQYLFDEAQIAASVDHPNVCKILELGQERGVLFIAMEWLHGAPLSTLVSRLPQRRLDFRIAAHLVAEACNGLHAAHEVTDDDGVHLEVVHRDATPHNLLISSAGELKVMDFGIVKSKNQQHQATQTGELKGKIAYLAPELIRGKAVDRRADIFTLGCVLYGITVGKGPFSSSGQDPGQTILRILEGDYATPSSVVSDYPAKLEAIVIRALALDVNQRFQSAEEMRLALEDFLSDGSRPVSRDEVAALLQRYCGPAIEQRRTEIRTAQKLFDSQAGQVRSGTFPAGENSSYDFPTPLVPPSEKLAVVAVAPPPARADRTLASESHELSAQRSVHKASVRAVILGLAGALGLAAVTVLLMTMIGGGRRGAPEAMPGPEAAPAAARLLAESAALPGSSTVPVIAPPQESAQPAASAALPERRAYAGGAPARPGSWHRPGPARPPTKLVEAPASPSESSRGTAAERAPAEPNTFAQPVPRKPVRHAIDESDPFGK